MTMFLISFKSFVHLEENRRHVCNIKYSVRYGEFHEYTVFLTLFLFSSDEYISDVCPGDYLTTRIFHAAHRCQRQNKPRTLNSPKAPIQRPRHPEIVHLYQVYWFWICPISLCLVGSSTNVYMACCIILMFAPDTFARGDLGWEIDLNLFPK